MSDSIDVYGKVVVVDGNGHWEAAGTAEYLADRSCHVELVAGGLLAGAELRKRNKIALLPTRRSQGNSLENWLPTC